jgi:UDP-N-acetylglucosamine 2-epimerase (non-hydrolysing)
VKLIYVIAGARPNFMKIAPLNRQLRKVPGFEVQIVHTGQHYDRTMSDVFFEQLGLGSPDVNLEVGSAPHGAQTGRVLERFESLVVENQPAAVVVVGDVNSTLACALAASKIQYADGTRPLVAHVEAGLRSRDRTMPEEINRILTDTIADVLFTTEDGARVNLAAEGIAEQKIHFVGNVMIDCLVEAWPRIEPKQHWQTFGLERRGYGLVTLHRPSNVDRDETLVPLLRSLHQIADRLPLVFPAHPRTRARLQAAGLEPHGALHVVEPLGYFEFLSLLSGARIMLTDSGGIQEETTFLRVPCLTLRDNTERPITVTHGTNTLVGSRPANLAEAALTRMEDSKVPQDLPPLWDGRAAERIARILGELLLAE